MFSGDDEAILTKSVTTRDINLEHGLTAQRFIFSDDFETKDTLKGY